jgi:hypothetical protein
MGVPTVPFIGPGREQSRRKAMVTSGSVGFNGATVFEHRSGTEWRGNGGAGPGEEAAAVRELRGGHWLSTAWQRPEIGSGGISRRKEKREQAKLGRTARREVDRTAWAGWQVGRFWEKVMESGWAAMEIGPKWDLGCQRKIEIALQISDSRKWDSNQKF